jgi:hypothetical protein
MMIYLINYYVYYLIVNTLNMSLLEFVILFYFIQHIFAFLTFLFFIKQFLAFLSFFYNSKCPIIIKLIILLYMNIQANPIVIN